MDEFGIVAFELPLRWSARITAPAQLRLLHRTEPLTLLELWGAVPKVERDGLAASLRRVFSGATVINTLLSVKGPRGTSSILVRGRVSGENSERKVEGVMANITAETGALRHQELAASDRAAMAVQELNHRVRNIMSVVTALITLSGRYAEDVDDFSRATLGRIQALNVAYSNTGIDPLQPQNLRQTVDLRVLAEGVLAPFAQARSSLQLSPMQLHLSPGQASAIGLILHELASNAAEHGALRSQEGQVTASWSKQGARFSLRWQERGGASTDGFLEGFGMSIVRLLARNYLNGDARWEQKDDVLTVTIDGFEN